MSTDSTSTSEAHPLAQRPGVAGRERIVVTGGAGFIGSHIADALLAQGKEVLILDNLASGRLENIPKGAVFENVDVADGPRVLDALRSFQPDAICHQAAQTSVSVSTRETLLDAHSNVLGTLQILEAAAALGIPRVVLASTGGAIYGEVPDGKKAAVGWPENPLSPYAISKLAAEKYLQFFARERGLQTTTLRYANVYGPRQDPHGEAGVVAIFSARCATGETSRINARKESGDDGCIRDYIYVGDVVRANLKALAGEFSAPVLNLGTGVETSTRTLLETLAAQFGVEAKMEFGPKRVGDLERSVLEPSLEPFQDAPATSLAEGLGQTAAWFRRKLSAS